jgi:hypothetical protein
VAFVHRPQHAVEVEGPTLGRVGPVLGGSERVVGDEHLLPVARMSLPELVRARAFVHLPAVRQSGEPEHARDRGLAHLRRTGDDREAVVVEHIERAEVRARRDEHAREPDSAVDVDGRTFRPFCIHQIGELTHAEDERHPPSHCRLRVERRADLRGTEHANVHVLELERGRVLVREEAHAPSHGLGAHTPLHSPPVPDAADPRDDDELAVVEQHRPKVVRVAVPTVAVDVLGREQLGAELLELQPAELVEPIGHRPDSRTPGNSRR